MALHPDAFKSPAERIAELKNRLAVAPPYSREWHECRRELAKIRLHHPELAQTSERVSAGTMTPARGDAPTTSSPGGGSEEPGPERAA